MNRVIIGHAMEALRSLPDESVHCCVTSPPYWGLRVYGTAQSFGGESACQHEWGEELILRGPAQGASASSQRQGRTSVAEARSRGRSQGAFCQKCSAWRGELGCEPVPDMYVQHLVEIFREVRRVLRDDGTLWLNLGDCFARSVAKGEKFRQKIPHRYTRANNPDKLTGPDIPPGLKEKDVVGIPWRVAFALQADGWWLRSDIVWHKPNCMPESVTDRPVKAHEYVFLLSKRERYFYDAEAIKHPASEASLKRIAQPNFSNQQGGPKDYRGGTNPNRSCRQTLENFAANPSRSMRSVWTIPTTSYSGAHFACFPEALVIPCIKAGTSEKGCCPACNAPWKRRKTVGWQPSCSCHVQTMGMNPLDPVPCVVIDPFLGSGTTALVAAKLGRRCVGIELQAKYEGLIKERLGLFAPVVEHLSGGKA